MADQRVSAHAGRRVKDRQRGDARRVLVLLRRWVWRIVAAYLLVLTAALLAVWSLQAQTSDLASRLAHSQLRTCHRLNLLRASDNVSHLVEFKTLSHFAVEPALRAQLTWIPLTRSCQAAVDHASTFHAPDPVHFTRRLPGPQELTVGPGE